MEYVIKMVHGHIEKKGKLRKSHTLASKLHKQKWVDGVETLLRRANSVEATERSLEFLSTSNSI